MHLYVMRHGAAEDSSPTGKDRDRLLSSKGRADVERAAAQLRAAHGGPLPRIVASPYLRTRETAEIVASVAGSPSAEIDLRPELAPDEDLPLLLVRGLVETGEDALLVGHHPMVIALLRALVRDVGELPLGLHPGMLVGVRSLGTEAARAQVTGGFAPTLVWKP
jgi:phosphohistidine phosphatase